MPEFKTGPNESDAEVEKWEGLNKCALVKDVEQIFRRETQAAMSVPATWNNVTQDHFLELMHRAGFPRSTAIVSEAISVGTYFLNQSSALAWGGGTVRDNLIIDIGGLTVDAAGLRKYTEAGKAKIVQTVAPIGSFDGALLIPHILMQRFVDRAGKGFESLMNNLGTTKKTFTEKVRKGLEVAVRSFRN